MPKALSVAPHGRTIALSMTDEVSLAEHEIDEQEGARGSPGAGGEWRVRVVCCNLAIERHFASGPAHATGKDPAPCTYPHL